MSRCTVLPLLSGWALPFVNDDFEALPIMLPRRPVFTVVASMAVLPLLKGLALPFVSDTFVTSSLFGFDD